MDRISPTLLACAIAAGVAACAPAPTRLPPPVQQCVTEPARWAIGQAATADVVERIRVDTGSAEVRVIHPGDVITMDYKSQRVNVKVNERNAIIGITCG